MLEVEHGGDVQRGIAGIQRAMALNITGHAVDDVGQGYAGVSVVRVVVDNRRRVDFAGACERPETLVPVDMTRRIRCVEDDRNQGVPTQRDTSQHRTGSGGPGTQRGYFPGTMTPASCTSGDGSWR